MTEKIEAVVIGGGYAGVMAANRLPRREDVTVTLVSTRPTFVPRLRLRQLAGGADDVACRELRHLLQAGRAGASATAERAA